MLRVAAEHADLWNIPGDDIDAAAAAGFPHIILGLPAPYPAHVAQWVTDELITTSAAG